MRGQDRFRMARIKYKEAAGLEVKRGRPPVGPAPSKAALVKLYVKESRSVRDVAAAPLFLTSFLTLPKNSYFHSSLLGIVATSSFTSAVLTSPKRPGPVPFLQAAPRTQMTSTPVSHSTGNSSNPILPASHASMLIS